MNRNSQTISLTIGIPAYNEEQGILPILDSLLNQHEEGFNLKEIIVLSDGSSDHTVSSALSVKDPRVTVFEDGNRLGKPARINEIFARANTDVVALFDADVEIHSQHLLAELLTPMIANKDISAVFGSADVLPLKNIVQKIVTVGWDMWEDLKNETPHAELYRCQGTIRAFRKDLYQVMRFPNQSADDAFPFLYCKKHSYNIAFAPKAVVYYAQPATYVDYVKQMVRFHGSQHVQQQAFEKSFVDQYYVISTRRKLKMLIRHGMKRPFGVSAYLLFLTVPKLISLFRTTESATPMWGIATSTKKRS